MRKKSLRAGKSEAVEHARDARPRLGLVCITHSEEVRYRALTRKRLLQFGEAEQRRLLRELYADNLARLNRALDFCAARGLRLYRMTSGLFPFADDAAGAGLLEEFREGLARTGARAAAFGIRLVLHPDQFVVLNSDSPQTVANSVKILETHARVLDLLGLPRSPWALIEIHGGKGGRADRLVENVSRLAEGVRSRIAFENDEYIYSAAEILDICRRAGVPMVFDAHHHVVHEGLDTYDHPSVAEMVEAARATWPDPLWQLAHISNGRARFGDRHHSDLVEAMPEAYRRVPWIEVEAKHKELAIEKLSGEWLAADAPEGAKKAAA
jgi:UV DNA damage endonuclease